MKRIYTLLLLLFGCGAANAQAINNTTVIDIAGVRDTFNISSLTRLVIDSSTSLQASGFIKKTASPLPEFKYRRSIPPEMITFAYGLEFSVSNTSDTAMSFYFYPGALYKKITVYKTGSPATPAEPVEVSSEKNKFYGFKKITLQAGEQTGILVYLRFVKNDFANINPQIINSRYIENFILRQLNIRSEIKTFGYIMSGVLLMMLLFMLTNFIISGRKEFLYNGLYSFCMFALVLLNSYTLRSLSPFTNFFMSYLDFFLLITGTIFYISFTRNFLDTRSRHRLLDTILRYGEVFILLMLVLYSILNFFSDLYFLQFLLENFVKLLILAIGVFFIVLAVKEKNPLLNYLAAGNAALVLFSTISLGMIWGNVRVNGLLTSPLFYYYLGIAIEFIFFLLGLTYKNRSELIERVNDREAMKLEAEKKDFETQITIMKAQQEERNRISADMHDDLGAGMTTIRLYSELAKNKIPENSIPEIDKISSSANELLNKMNAIIWSMTSSNDSLGNMTSYIRSYALEYFENTGINCHINIPENLPNIEVIGEIRRNVFLVVKEALNNILKHSKATEVNITLERVPDGLTLYIHDNGIGINLDELRQFGNGLKNMKKRMEDIAADFNIENRNGTLITLHRYVNTF